MKNTEKTIHKDLLPIDCLFSKELKVFYSTTPALMEDIWPGMKPCSVCIYRMDGPAFLFKHPSPPETFLALGDDLWVGRQSDLQLFGNTQLEISGVLTAICDYGMKDCSVESFFPVLFHEMHHVYQSNCMKSLKVRSDNPAQVVTYPEIVKNDALKILEGRLLLQILLANEASAIQDLLNLFLSCRLERGRIVGASYLDFEKRVESIEGPAAYCQYLCIEKWKKSAWTKASYRIRQCSELLSTLGEQNFGRENLRSRSLTTGLAFCLILNKLKKEKWEVEYFNSDLLLQDFFFSKFSAYEVPLPDIRDIEVCASFFVQKVQMERKQRLTRFEQQEGVRVELTFENYPEFRGFDPMNAEGIDETSVLHHTLLQLVKGDNQLSFLNGNVLTRSKNGCFWAVETLIFYVKDRDQINICNDKIMLDIKGRNLLWTGTIVSESEAEISILLKC